MTESEVETAIANIRVDSLDDAAWSRFYVHYRGQVLGTLAISGVRDRDIREELCAEVFYRFARYCPWHTAWSTLPGAAIVGSYIRTTTENVFRAWLEDIVRLPKASETATSAESSENALLSADIIRKLRPQDRQFLDCYVKLGFSLSAVSAQLSISYSAAGTRLHRIRRRIKEMTETVPRL